MDMTITAAELAFRDEVRAFLAEHLKPEWRGVAEHVARADRAVAIEWQKVLAAHGWLTSGWPAKYGGRQLSAMERYIFNSECAKLRAPAISSMDFGMVAPLIYTYGNQAQQDYYLPRILWAEDTWAQGFSEPGSGSDLASLRTSARREGDHYIVNGQKIWTTNAHLATQMFALVRTDPDAPKPQMGITMVILPMTLPGITVRPIPTIDGRHHFNEVFLDNVRVPVEGLVGEENKGWTYAKSLLAHERQGIADVQPTRLLWSEVAGVASHDAGQRGARTPDADTARKLAALEIEIDSLETLEFRAMERAALGIERGYEASLLKLLGSRLRQDVLTAGLEMLGPFAEARPGPFAPTHPSGMGQHFVDDAIFCRATTIFGGSSEVQRNIVSKVALGGNGDL